jgi:hypothetical protein
MNGLRQTVSEFFVQRSSFNGLRSTFFVQQFYVQRPAFTAPFSVQR